MRSLADLPRGTAGIKRAAAVGLTVAACAGGAGAAQAETVTFGSSLAEAPNLQLGCETQPQLSDTTGNYGFAPSGQPGCTWRQAGVFGQDSGTLYSSVPGDGTITRVDVRSGANPAPLSFVVFRQLGNTGATQDTQCCFFVSTSPAVTPQPNAVSSFSVDIPVHRNTLNGVRAFDLMGISAESNAGTLPLREVGPHLGVTFAPPGSLFAGFFYPSLGAQANDSGGGRLEDATSGIELTVRWTWTGATGAASARSHAAGAGALPPSPFSGFPEAGRSLRHPNPTVLVERGLVALAASLLVHLVQRLPEWIPKLHPTAHSRPAA